MQLLPRRVAVSALVSLAAWSASAAEPEATNGACGLEAVAAAVSYEALYPLLRCGGQATLQAAQKINGLDSPAITPPARDPYPSSAALHTATLAVDVYFDTHLSRPPLSGFYALQRLVERIAMLAAVESVSIEGGVDAYEGAMGEQGRLAADRAERVRRWLAEAGLNLRVPVAVSVRPAPSALPAQAVDRSARIRVHGLQGLAARPPLIQPTPAGQNNAGLVYPPISKRLGEQGRVVLLVKISDDGSVVTPQVRVGSGFARLDAAALDMVRGWRYDRNSASANTWFNLPVNFVLEDAQPPAQPRPGTN